MINTANLSVKARQAQTELHRDELLDDWGRAERDEPLVSIDPLP